MRHAVKHSRKLHVRGRLARVLVLVGAAVVLRHPECLTCTAPRRRRMPMQPNPWFEAGRPWIITVN